VRSLQFTMVRIFRTMYLFLLFELTYRYLPTPDFAVFISPKAYYFLFYFFVSFIKQSWLYYKTFLVDTSCTRSLRARLVLRLFPVDKTTHFTWRYCIKVAITTVCTLIIIWPALILPEMLQLRDRDNDVKNERTNNAWSKVVRKNTKIKSQVSRGRSYKKMSTWCPVVMLLSLNYFPRHTSGTVISWLILKVALSYIVILTRSSRFKMRFFLHE